MPPLVQAQSRCDLNELHNADSVNARSLYRNRSLHKSYEDWEASRGVQESIQGIDADSLKSRLAVDTTGGTQSSERTSLALETEGRSPKEVERSIR